jgi:hypothetical protein
MSHESLQEINQPSFKRSPHDKKHPFTIISNEMIRDRSISPKAKGVLLYFLHLPDNWLLYHSQIQYALNIGEDYLNSAIEELIQGGYVSRTRPKVKGKFQPYQYEISEFKIFLPDGKNRSGDPYLGKQPPGYGLDRTGFSGPENPALLSTNVNPDEEQQQEAPPPGACAPAAVSSKQKIYDCLISFPIQLKEKELITQKFSEEAVKHAVAFTYDAEKKKGIKTSIIQTLKWACETQPEIPKSREDKILEAKRYAESKADMASKFGRIDILNQHVEIVFGGQKEPVAIRYDDSGFNEQLDNALRKYEFK